MTRSWLSGLAKFGFRKKTQRTSSRRRGVTLGSCSRVCRIESLEERLALYASTTLVDNGPVDQRIDLVFLGDGFIQSELSTFTDKVDVVVDEFFQAAPFDTYASYFNVHRVNVISIESGIDQPDSLPPVEVNTALDGTVGENNFYDVNMTKLRAAAGDAPDFDLINAVLSNYPRSQ